MTTLVEILTILQNLNLTGNVFVKYVVNTQEMTTKTVI